jgi:hypothetical protein
LDDRCWLKSWTVFYSFLTNTTGCNAALCTFDWRLDATMKISEKFGGCRSDNR